ncbi:MAG: hypothetical protein K0U65_11110, partial [Gammaproteobacteria bacterium]|nr:hypothetical protein [Gammaproteobacteria bacterium]
DQKANPTGSLFFAPPQQLVHQYNNPQPATNNRPPPAGGYCQATRHFNNNGPAPMPASGVP